MPAKKTTTKKPVTKKRVTKSVAKTAEKKFDDVKNQFKEEAKFVQEE
jgi:hypothetical protein